VKILLRNPDSSTHRCSDVATGSAAFTFRTLD
jgi:hypothetical protein